MGRMSVIWINNGEGIPVASVIKKIKKKRNLFSNRPKTVQKPQYITRYLLELKCIPNSSLNSKETNKVRKKLANDKNGQINFFFNWIWEKKY